MSGVVIPNDRNAEVCVISAMLVDSSCIPMVVSELSDEDFYHRNNRVIYACIRSLYNEQKPVDLMTVAERLTADQTIKIAGGISYLNDVADVVISGTNVGYYVQLVKKYSALRTIHLENVDITSKIANSNDPATIMANLDRMVSVISGVGKKAAISISDIIDESYGEFSDYIDGKSPPKISMCWSRHDSILGGLGAGRLIIVGARPAMGKTQYMVNLARNIGAMGSKVYVKSYEMTRLEIVDRMINMNSRDGIYFSSEKNKDRSKIDVRRVMDAYNEMYAQVKGVTINIDDYAGDDTSRLKARMLKLKTQNLIDIGFVDYLQLIPKTKAQLSEKDPLGQVSRDLKVMAKDVGIPIVVASQLNRKLEERTDKRPKMSDLRESGAIEQDADAVLFLHRDDYFENSGESVGIMEIIVAKNRHGATGIVKVYYDRRSGVMYEVEEYIGEYESD